MRRFKLLSILSFFVLFFISCLKEEVSNQSEKNSLIILKNFSPEEKTLVNNLFFLNNPNFIEIIDPNNIESLSLNEFNNKLDSIKVIHTNDIMLVNINYSAFFQNTFFLQAGDILEIDFSDINEIKQKHFGENILEGDITNMKYKDTVLLTPNFFVKDKEDFEKRSLKDSLETIRSRSKLDSLFEINKITKSIFNLKRNIYNCQVEAKKVRDFRFDYNTEELLLNDSLIGLKDYKNFLLNYNRNYYKIKDIQSKQNSYLDSKAAFDSVFVSKKYNEKSRSFLLFYYLEEMIVNFNKEDVILRLDKMMESNIEIDKINNFRNKHLLDFRSNDKNDIELISSNKKKISMKEIFETELVYVDFWASWCAPCRASFPYSRQLMHKYKDYDFKIIYISIDKDFSSWQKAVIKESLNDNNSFLSLNYPESNFYEENKLKSIPRYMIFYRGKLVNNNAPSPDSSGIEDEINRYLLK